MREERVSSRQVFTVGCVRVGISHRNHHATERQGHERCIVFPANRHRHRIRLRHRPRHGRCAGRGGRIIAVTSVHEFQPRVGASAYDASKHGLGGLIKTMALELAEFGITANNVAPGEIATPMTGQTDEDPRQKERPGVPLGRPGDAREIAAVIAFLASPDSSYVTGASWPVDGGMLQMGPHAGSHITGNEWRES